MTVSPGVLTFKTDEEVEENIKRKISQAQKRAIAMARCPDGEVTVTVDRENDGSTMLFALWY